MKKLILLTLLLVSSYVSFAQRLGQPIIYFVPPGYSGYYGDQILIAIIEKRPSGTNLDIAILFSGNIIQNTIANAHATSLTDGLNGNKWCTIAEAITWGVDLSDKMQALTPYIPGGTMVISDYYLDASYEIKKLPTRMKWDSLTSVPSTFTPSAHIHPQADITGLTAAMSSLTTTASNGIQNLGLSGQNITISNGTGITIPQSDWAQSNSGAIDFIKNKPTIPAAVKNFEALAGTTNGTGDATVTFTKTYSVAPSVNPTMIQSLSEVNQIILVSNITSTGCTIKTVTRDTGTVALLGLVILPTVTNLTFKSFSVQVMEK